jgi:hypothetical protein
MTKKKKEIDVSKLPDNLQSVEDTGLALKYWIKDLYYKHFKEHDIELIICSRLGIPQSTFQQYYKTTVEEIQLRRKRTYRLKVLETDKEKLEEYIETGLKEALQKQDMKAYFNGLTLLATLMGVSKQVSLEVRDNTKKGIKDEVLDQMNQTPNLEDELNEE